MSGISQVSPSFLSTAPLPVLKESLRLTLFFCFKQDLTTNDGIGVIVLEFHSVSSLKLHLFVFEVKYFH